MFFIKGYDLRTWETSPWSRELRTIPFPRLTESRTLCSSRLWTSHTSCLPFLTDGGDSYQRDLGFHHLPSLVHEVAVPTTNASWQIPCEDSREAQAAAPGPPLFGKGLPQNLTLHMPNRNKKGRSNDFFQEAFPDFTLLSWTQPIICICSTCGLSLFKNCPLLSCVVCFWNCVPKSNLQKYNHRLTWHRGVFSHESQRNCNIVITPHLLGAIFAIYYHILNVLVNLLLLQFNIHWYQRNINRKNRMVPLVPDTMLSVWNISFMELTDFNGRRELMKRTCNK